MPNPAVAPLAPGFGHGAGRLVDGGREGASRGWASAGAAADRRASPMTPQERVCVASGRGRGSWTPGYENRLVAF